MVNVWYITVRLKDVEDMQYLILEKMKEKENSVKQCHEILDPTMVYQLGYEFRCMEWKETTAGTMRMWQGDFFENCSLIPCLGELIGLCRIGRPSGILEFNFSGKGRKWVTLDRKGVAH